MKIASILLLFCLITSLTACMNPFSACSHYFENIQVISDANRLTAFSMMVISIEGSFRAIRKIIFFVNRILLLLPVLHQALVFLICMVYLVFFTLYIVSVLGFVLIQLAKALPDLPLFTTDQCSFDLRLTLLGLYSCF